MTDYTLRPSNELPKIFLYRQPVDFRKSYRGLGAIVEQELGHNPFSGIVYVFVNRHYPRIKCLFWEHNGFVLYYKALAEEKFRWPKDNESLMTITGQQLNWMRCCKPLLNCFTITSPMTLQCTPSELVNN